MGRPALALGRSVVVGDEFGFVHLLDREDGTLLNRLASGLGLVVFKTPSDGECTEERLWVSPGNPMIRHGGTQQALRIRARQTVTLGECK